MCLTYTVYYNSHRHYTYLFTISSCPADFCPVRKLPDSSAVELVTEGVQHGVEDRRRLGQHRQYLEDLQTHDLSSQGKTLKMLFSHHSELWGTRLTFSKQAYMHIRTYGPQQSSSAFRGKPVLNAGQRRNE